MRMLMLRAVLMALAIVLTARPVSADDGRAVRYLGQSADAVMSAGTPATFAACWSWDVWSITECRTVTVAYAPGRYLVIIPGPESTYAFAVLTVVP